MQIRKDKIVSCTDGLTELSQTPNEEDSLCPKYIYNGIAKALKTKSQYESMIQNKEVIRELKWWIRRIEDNQPESLIHKTETGSSAKDA
ncbi:MAG: hypothetical protein EZS28_023548 [Streblomastix strix]|uniref:PPM-type phosphatase domain-containing protein n=1 Tax=Streblomastix strix TaxID=222440 RepID=A0A5J4VEG3_9EUKA|nr:MAG: hypothetical protein EZS28_023548 [Streblomastix strix]